MLDSDASTAKTLTLVAIVLQIIFFVIGIIEVISILAFLSLSGIRTTTGTLTITSTVPFGAFGIIYLIFSFALLIGIIWIFLDYFLIYKRLAEEKVEEAKTPALVLGIIQLLFGGLISGILLIIAYVKINDSINKRKYTQQTQQGVYP